jgi:hypothetical protein
MSIKYFARKKSGRAFNAAHRDAGVLIHAVTTDAFPEWVPALCGTKPGASGNGWALAETENTITCKKCLSKLKNSN